MAFVAVTIGLASATNAGTTTIDLRDEWDVRIGGPYRPVVPGDVNGDGAADLASGDCLAFDRAGATYVMFGPFEQGEDTRGDARADNGFVIQGPAPERVACFPYRAGDVNGDGLDDIMVTSVAAEPNGEKPGTTYVVFGKTDTNPVNLADFENNIQGPQGFRIDGPHGFAQAGIDAAPADDMNQDGLDDVVIGAPFAQSAYVVFGKKTPTPVDLATFDNGIQDQGFRIITPAPGRNIYAVGGGSDTNGDSVPDVVVGMMPIHPGTSGNPADSMGRAYVVFGKPDPEMIDTRDQGSWGYKIRGRERGDMTGYAVTLTADMNGDGLGEVVVGAPDVNAGCYCRGRAFVIFGTPDTESIRLDRLGELGFVIKGRRPGGEQSDYLGAHVEAAGDVNGDGGPDLIIGATGTPYPKRGLPGAAFVIYGKASNSPVLARRLGDKGFRLIGAHARSSTGLDIAGGSDFDQDGRDDVVTISGDATYIVWTHP